MKNNTRRILVILLVVAVALIVWSVAAKQSSDELSGSASEVANIAGDTVSYSGEDGQSALDLLKRDHRVEGDAYVTAIDGKAGDSEHFWGYYVNGEVAQVGAADYLTKNGDTIEWRYEVIK